MGRDIYSYIVFGFLIDGTEINRLFGTKSDEVEDEWGSDGWIFHVPWKHDEELSCQGEVVTEICVEVKRRLGIQTSYVEGGSYFHSRTLVYGIGPRLRNAEGFSSLEELMRKEQDACEVGAFLRLLGFEVEPSPKVFSLYLEI